MEERHVTSHAGGGALSSSWPPAKRSAAAASLARRGGVLQSESKGSLLHLFLGHSNAVVC